MTMLLKAVLNGLYYTGIQSICAPLTQGVGSILMLHRVGNFPVREFSPNSHLSVSPEFLDVTILRLKQAGYEFVSMDEMAERLSEGSWDRSDRPAIAITLDDGYRDNLENALPVFKRHEVPFTIFIAPGLVDASHTIWWEDLEHLIASTNRIGMKLPDRGFSSFDTKTTAEKLDAFSQLMAYLTTEVSEYQQREILSRLSNEHNHDGVEHARNSIMNWKELKSLAQDPLCTLGAHTIGHYAVARLSQDSATAEISESRSILEDRLGQPIQHFAYPYGYPAAAGNRDFEIVRELGFKTGVTTRHGVLYPEHKDHLSALPRISLNGSYQSMRYVRTLLSGVTTRMNNRGGKLNVA